MEYKIYNTTKTVHGKILQDPWWVQQPLWQQLFSCTHGHQLHGGCGAHAPTEEFEPPGDQIINECPQARIKTINVAALKKDLFILLLLLFTNLLQLCAR